nr:SDR family NAD(P)-dependent oxidoreductase [Acinetobacter sp. Marseille-Q1620]
MKKIIITGANAGIGFSTAKILVEQGHHVILACRNLEKAQSVKQILDQIGTGQIDIIQLDLNSLDAVNHAAEQVLAQYTYIDVLINNAGLINTRLEATEDGYEKHFGVNYLGHFLWTLKLLPLLKQSQQGRIIHLSSIAHLAGRVQPQYFKAENIKHFQTFLYYANSKLANLLFSNELARQLQGSSVTSNALHPGVVDSELYRHLPRYQYKVVSLALIPPERPAKRIVEMALASQWTHKNGQYESVQTPAIQSPKARNQHLAKSLYQDSITLIEKYLH